MSATRKSKINRLNFDGPSQTTSSLFSECPRWDSPAQAPDCWNVDPCNSNNPNNREWLTDRQSWQNEYTPPLEGVLLANLGGCERFRTPNTAALFSAPHPGLEFLERLRRFDLMQNLAGPDQRPRFESGPTQLSNIVAELGQVLSDIENHYSLKRPGPIKRFLAQHPPIARMLPTAVEQLTSYFGAAASWSLDVQTDPELPNITQLLIFIKPSVDLEAAIRQMDEFDVHWWLEQPESRGNDVCFLIDVA